jgi:CRP-like cAMP-binding protein
LLLYCVEIIQQDGAACGTRVVHAGTFGLARVVNMNGLAAPVAPLRALEHFPAAVTRNRLLASLPHALLELIAPHLVERRFSRGTELSLPAHAFDHVFFPDSGLIAVQADVTEGRGIVVALVGRDSAVGLSAALGSSVAVNRATVEVATTGATIAASTLAGLARSNDGLIDILARANDRLLAQIQRSAACHALHELQPRLCTLLLRAREQLAGDVVPLRQDELSSMLGVQRTSINLVCATLQNEGLVRTGRGHVDISDVAGLEARACSCHADKRQL